MRAIPFVKMDGLGNDFVILREIDLTPDEIRAIGNRKTGVGFDQLIVLKPSDRADLKLLFFNADGSSAGACGNGSRCAARYFMDGQGRSRIEMEAPDGRILKARRAENDQTTVNMGKPLLGWREIPVAAPVDTTVLPEIVKGLPAPVGVSMGNPHAVFFVKDVDSLDIAAFGPKVENHPFFPERTNVEFAEVLAPDVIRMRVWERGTGVTEACGTGACATLTAAVRRNLSARKAEIRMDGGSLVIEWDENGDILMTGATHAAFKGELYL